ncbi:MAG: hypothetical protein KR126chlam1_01232 [Chlamydiae bacterium]|nr:hypothetical protein [Chlamydiota bacterium]
MTLILSKNTKKSVAPTKVTFDVKAELMKHAWCPEFNRVDAEKALEGQVIYTYLIRPNLDEKGKYILSFIHKNGDFEHHTIRLLNPIYGIWRQGSPHHIGELHKVVCDVLDCEKHERIPLF